MERRNRNSMAKVTHYSSNKSYAAGISLDKVVHRKTLFDKAGIQKADADIGDCCSETCYVQQLPDDVWFLICRYLNVGALCKLCQVCKCFRRVASADCVWQPHLLMRTGFDLTCRSPCSMKERYRVAMNWDNGDRNEFWILRYNYRLLPWLQRDDDTLLVSKGNTIHQFTMEIDGSLQEKKKVALKGLSTDVTRFVVRNGIVVSGCRDGGVLTWEASSGTRLLQCRDAHRSDTQCVDVADNCIVSGSKDKTVKVLSMFPEDKERVKKCFNLEDRVWSLCASPCGKTVAVGTACHINQPIVLLDISSGGVLGHLGDNLKRGGGVLDMKFESPHTLLTCGHDTYLRLWDLRTHTCVNQWEEQFDSALYCVVTDGHHSILTGTARNGLVRLWDNRKTEDVMAYYSNHQSSPVYSLAANSHFMYLALDRGLNFVDFS